MKYSDTDFNSHNIDVLTGDYLVTLSTISLLQDSERKSGDSDTQSKNVSENVSGAASNDEESDNVRNYILW